ncbi:hypothetical protein C1H46_009564 [Malus baccata]|uniref:Uncharacterized protein n=1 Tax=Malus baccata TaxID=106549 RepID=A0A540N2U6_MALBA|nr:hypothetical protein C1H46_009564 [Malus baccata]
MMLQHQLMMSRSGTADSGFGPMGLSLGNNGDFDRSNNDLGNFAHKVPTRRKKNSNKINEEF